MRYSIVFYVRKIIEPLLEINEQDGTCYYKDNLIEKVEVLDLVNKKLAEKFPGQKGITHNQLYVLRNGAFGEIKNPPGTPRRFVNPRSPRVDFDALSKRVDNVSENLKLLSSTTFIEILKRVEYLESVEYMESLNASNAFDKRLKEIEGRFLRHEELIFRVRDKNAAVETDIEKIKATVRDLKDCIEILNSDVGEVQKDSRTISGKLTSCVEKLSSMEQWTKGPAN
jgi:uncharacterized coiled-coil protein SlyX